MLSIPTSNSPYKEAYQLYRRLANHLCNATDDKDLAIGLADTILSQKDAQQIKWAAKDYGLLTALEPHWDDIHKIQEMTLELTGGRRADNPLPDVYAAALFMRMGDIWLCEPDSVYRGQRNHAWSTTPSLYRFPDKMEYYKIKLHQFVYFLRERYPQFTENQGIAIAQHFSADNEAGTKTHFVDITWDPFVALFFASDGGKKGDVGKINRLIVPEWNKLVLHPASSIMI